MTEDPLAHLHEEPRPEFAATLRRRLQAIEAQDQERRASRRRAAPVLVTAALLAVVGFSLSLRPVRAAAQSFLELFRVKRFAAVAVDPERLARLHEGKLDFKTLVGEQVEVIEPGREPEVVDGLEAAAALAGATLRQPSVLPQDAALAEVRVGSPGHFRVRLDVAKLEAVAQALGVEDVEVPPSWDGATVEVAGSPVVGLRYHRREGDFVLLQSRSPEVQLPAGVDLQALGAIALRLAGMSAEEAAIFARKVDWRSTLLVPMPAEGGSFREVDVNGAQGLLVTAFRPSPPGPDGRRGRGPRESVLLWSTDDRVFALSGPGDGVIVLDMAQSVR